MPFRRFLAALPLLVLVPASSTHAAEVVAGPVVGVPTPREVGLWVRLDGPAEVTLEWHPEGRPDAIGRAPAVTTDPADGWSARLTAGPLLPATRYIYRLRTGDRVLPLPAGAGFTTAPDWRDRSPPPDTTFVVLGAHAAPDPVFDIPYRPAGTGFEIFPFVTALRPDFVLWVGGHLGLRPGDADSAIALRERYTQTRLAPGLPPLLAGTPHLAVLAPADFSPPGTGAGAWSPAGAAARDAFRRAWPASTAFPSDAPTAHGLFQWSDAAFLLLDVCSARRDDRSSVRRARLGEAQIAWLLDALEHTPATFRFVVAGHTLLSPRDEPDAWHHAREEQQFFLDALASRRIPGVIVLSGGPVGEASKSVRARGYDLYEFTAGPSTARSPGTPSGLNYFRMPGTLVTDRHALLVSVRGPEGDRRVVVTSTAPDGTQHWTTELTARQLRD